MIGVRRLDYRLHFPFAAVASGVKLHLALLAAQGLQALGPDEGFGDAWSMVVPGQVIHTDRSPSIRHLEERLG
jgi:hypothetical protein